MKRLRIELAGERLDLRFVHEVGVAYEALPHLKIIEIEQVLAAYLIRQVMIRPPANGHSTNDSCAAHDSRTSSAHSWSFVYGAPLEMPKCRKARRRSLAFSFGETGSGVAEQKCEPRRGKASGEAIQIVAEHSGGEADQHADEDACRMQH